MSQVPIGLIITDFIAKARIGERFSLTWEDRARKTHQWRGFVYRRSDQGLVVVYDECDGKKEEELLSSLPIPEGYVHERSRILLEFTN